MSTVVCIYLLLCWTELLCALPAFAALNWQDFHPGGVTLPRGWSVLSSTREAEGGGLTFLPQGGFTASSTNWALSNWGSDAGRRTFKHAFHQQEQRQSWNQGRYRWKCMKTGIWTWRLPGFGCKLILVSHSAAPPRQIKTCLNFRKAKETPTISRNKTAWFLLVKYKSYLINMQLVNTMCNTGSKNDEAQKPSDSTELWGFILSLRHAQKCTVVPESFIRRSSTVFEVNSTLHL